MRGKFTTDDDSGYGTAFRDVIFSLFAVIAAVVIILLLLPKEPNKSANDADVTRGNIRVEIRWDDTANVDVDLWGKAPNEKPVGYSNYHSKVLSLVRDDLGSYADISNLNYEIMFSRGLPMGEWVFNVHWFGNAQGLREIPVTVIITITKDDSVKSKSKRTQIVSTKVVLTHVGQELTIIRFKLDKDANVIPSSMNSIYTPLRSLK